MRLVVNKGQLVDSLGEVMKLLGCKAACMSNPEGELPEEVIHKMRTIMDTISQVLTEDTGKDRIYTSYIPNDITCYTTESCNVAYTTGFEYFGFDVKINYYLSEDVIKEKMEKYKLLFKYFKLGHVIYEDGKKTWVMGVIDMNFIWDKHIEAVYAYSKLLLQGDPVV